MSIGWPTGVIPPVIISYSKMLHLSSSSSSLLPLLKLLTCSFTSLWMWPLKSSTNMHARYPWVSDPALTELPSSKSQLEFAVMLRVRKTLSSGGCSLPATPDVGFFNWHTTTLLLFSRTPFGGWALKITNGLSFFLSLLAVTCSVNQYFSPPPVAT